MINNILSSCYKWKGISAKRERFIQNIARVPLLTFLLKSVKDNKALYLNIII